MMSAHGCYPQCTECRRIQCREFNRRNPHIGWAATYRMRAKKLGVTPVVERFTKADVIAMYGNCCAYCVSGEFQELDHYTPIVHGGSHTLANVRPSCRKCNSVKARSEKSDSTRWP